MEAIAAAGALPGLASATVQLGTTTFHFYQQLRSLYKAIKEGQSNLDTAMRRLDQHQGFIEELKHNFERIPEGHFTDGLRDVFHQCIADSEDEVQELKTLLDQVGKHRFRNRSLRAIETGTRLRFNDESIQKYCSLLDKQMNRFLFFQISAESSRMATSVAGVAETLARQGEQATAFYSSFDSTMQQVRRTATRMRRYSPQERRGTVPDMHLLLGHDLTDEQWRYRTPCGWLTVQSCSWQPRNDVPAYKVRFEPFRWMSRALVEWRCCLQHTQSIPTLCLSTATGIICDDMDVVDALGFIPCDQCHARIRENTHWHTKSPRPDAVRALLAAKRLSKSHLLCVPFGIGEQQHQDVVTAFIANHQLCDRDKQEWLDDSHHARVSSYCSYSDPLCQSAFYADYYDTARLLLDNGFEPVLSSWYEIYLLAIEGRNHVTNVHPELQSSVKFSSQSVPRLILEAAGGGIAVDFPAACSSNMLIPYPRARISPHHFGNTTGLMLLWDPSLKPRCHIGPMLLLNQCADVIQREFLDLDMPDLAAEEFRSDRWLLVIYSIAQPELATLLQRYLAGYSNAKVRPMFTLDYVCDEIAQAAGEYGVLDPEYDLLVFLGYHCSADILRVLTSKGLDARGLVLPAALSQNPVALDFITHGDVMAIPAHLWHIDIMQDKLEKDPDFLKIVVDRLFSGVDFSSLNYNLRFGMESPLFLFIAANHMTLDLCMLREAVPMPKYMDLLVSGLLQKHEHPSSPSYKELHLLFFEAMMFHCLDRTAATELVQPLHFTRILRQIVQSPAFRSQLDSAASHYPRFPHLVDAGGISPLTPTSSINGYSALMQALHSGMSPAVQVLVDAGASITRRTSSGKSPLQVARENVRSSHPRPWFTARDEKNGGHSLFRRYEIAKLKATHVAESTDQAMLEILLKALRDRGEEEDGDEYRKQDPDNSILALIRARAGVFSRWLFMPTYDFDPEKFRQNSIYVILVTCLWFLSVFKVFQIELGDYIPRTVNVLTRPVVILALLVWILASLFR
ncbi:hypothetical protein F4780DRAFT_739281 [Xylariomycetidae sp. FL0641]|nr:hypothetical protein F4780DRAFT_739281 [Xylariomycetidae sp. FL0641]